MNTTAIFVHLHEPDNSESQVQFGGRGRARLRVNPISDLIGGFFSPTSHHLNPRHERSQHVAVDSSLRLSGWSLFSIIYIYMKINSFLQHSFTCPQVTPLPVIDYHVIHCIYLTGNRFLCCESIFGEDRRSTRTGQSCCSFYAHI